MSRKYLRLQRFLGILAIALCLSIGTHQANGQYARISPKVVAEQVYQIIPDLALENQYVSVSTGEVDPEHTLVSRLVRYHQNIKGRYTQYRLDWKLTIADYLGVNDTISADRYPGYKTLETNPLEGDRQVINQLNRRQRDDLVNVLVGIYNPQTNSETESESSSGESRETPSSPNPVFPQPGDADLLLP